MAIERLYQERYDLAVFGSRSDSFCLSSSTMREFSPHDPETLARGLLKYRLITVDQNRLEFILQALDLRGYGRLS